LYYQTASEAWPVAGCTDAEKLGGVDRAREALGALARLL
jgi:hypothetical protein